MEMHHRLRRDPNWHPNSCNICGQMGHQAAQCTTGTVNWKNMYGAESFLLRRPVFWSEIEAMMKAKQIDYDNLEAKAKEYAEAKKSGKLPSSSSSAAAPSRKPEDIDLPPGWATAKDAEGKMYYWNKQTKKVQWNKPTAEEQPVVASAPAVAAPPSS